MKRIISVITSFCILFLNLTTLSYALDTEGEEFAGGNGTKSHPYLISTKNQLNNVRNYLDAYFCLINDIVFENTDFEEGGDFYHINQLWIPIGLEDKYDNNYAPFTGCFDGNGFSIKNLHIKTCENTGLFGINEGIIKNLDLEIYVDDHDFNLNTFSFCIGGISAINSGNIASCNVSGLMQIDMTEFEYLSKSVQSYSRLDNCMIGAITGDNLGSIIDCQNNAKVIVDLYHNFSANDKSMYITSRGYIDLSLYLGGISGRNRGDINRCCNLSSINSSSSRGASTDSTFSPQVYMYNYQNNFVGGVAGSNEGVVENCYNLNSVVVNIGSFASICKSSEHVALCKSYAYAGGIVGNNNNTVTSCYNAGEIVKSEDSYDCYYGNSVASSSALIGNICGENNSENIEYCYYIEGDLNGVANSSVDVDIEALSTTQFKKKENFIGFDFETVWKMGSLYPQLQKYEEHDIHIHKYSKVPTEPTCTNQGYTTYICVECRDSFMSDYVEATGHSPKAAVKENIKSATCYKAGSYDEVVYCSVAECKAELSRTEKTIEAAGHSFGDYVSNGNGTQTRTCSVCGEKETINEPVKSVAEEVVRVKGKTRYETSIAIANETKAKMGVDKFDNIIIASGTNFADALAGSYLAKVKSAPILMSSGKNDAQLKDYVRANLKAGGTVYILGGTAAVPQNTEDAMKSIGGITVKRLKDKNRYGTNLAILREAGVQNEDIIVATGLNFADSLSASAVGKPILLVNGKGNGLTAEQKSFLASANANNIYIIGGTGAVSEAFENQLKAYGSVERVKGKSRYETSVAIAEKFFASPDYAVIAYAENFPDGLCGGPLAMTMDSPLILTKTGKQVAAKGYMQAKGIESGAVLGGASLIDDATAKDIFGASEVIVK